MQPGGRDQQPLGRMAHFTPRPVSGLDHPEPGARTAYGTSLRMTRDVGTTADADHPQPLRNTSPLRIGHVLITQVFNTVDLRRVPRRLVSTNTVSINRHT